MVDTRVRKRKTKAIRKEDPIKACGGRWGSRTVIASQKTEEERLQDIINSSVISIPKRDQGRRLKARPPDM